MDDKEYLNNLRHSCAHLLAASVLELWPGTYNAIGPAIENGFYQDFDFGAMKITEEDLSAIEQKMQQILATWDTLQIREVPAEQARKDFAHNPYKLELVEEFTKEGKTITETVQGKFLDLCKGGHLENPKDIKHFKLLSIAGAYWRGSEKNKMLTRIYGTCFPTQEELDKYLEMLEEAKKRDHKKLGPQLELFFFHETSPGMAYWLPKGVILYNELISFWREEHAKRGYQEIVSPILNKKDLYITSGHFDHYWQDMFVANMGPNEEYGMKAMNCPNAMVIFGFKTRSYKDLPLRLSDTDPLHRYELSGVLNGLFRVREFRQDDAHIFVSESQIEDEYKRLFEIVEKFYSIFNLEYSFRLGKRPEKFMGDPKVWDKAEEILEKILKQSGKDYFVAEKEGAFYGPKIDILMKDSLGREWQMGTLQLDFQQPVRFDLKYTDADGQVKTPIAIHRVVYGSLERFIGILIEHYAGALPVWLSPIQVQIIPIADRHHKYAQNVLEQLKSADIRVKVDLRAEKMQAKIRDAQLQKIPYMIIVGDREQSENKVALRTRSGEDLGAIKLDEFIKKIKTTIESKL
ncbi:threonine--tRNA ligase [Candidatus Daviesbacteria bacterium RIFCSPHIGHO2_02_FULL_39_12]|uniref:Threonine--tRNA ligase n=1 Tax=Candidatus Daviesbacteria bacterium RIFCSPHIGHO2_02_FULL_39_12 TaxID=1797770 RepID=A0A1F5J924_9BACT|nr:MAG: threonine--tRNA ligase [Candidatus Daviesbacteria bacterium RIFCSPHIGHO2_02_FULL_39_12]